MTQLAELLVGWLPRQRWFAGKGVPIDALAVEAQHTVVNGDPELRILVVRVEQRGRATLYQVLVGVRVAGTLAHTLTHASIGVCDIDGRGGGTRHEVYDAVHDPDLTRDVLHALAKDADLAGVRFRRLPGTTIHTGLRSLALPGEQSNTSLVFGDEHILKIFRRLWPGRNPDLELHEALIGSPYLAAPQGWVEADIVDPATGDLVPTTLAFLQHYLRSATDGWSLAATSVRDLYATPELAPEDAGGDFAGEARRLGRATAATHRRLAEVLPTATLRPDQIAGLAADMTERLDAAVAEIGELAPYAPVLGSAFDALARTSAPLPLQRIHGDYHLEQVVRTDSGWVLLDFEGEPAVPVTERRKLSSPLRDVAGMLRSFDYAARYQLVGHDRESELRGPARDWAQRNRDAFCAGYADATGIDPAEQRAVLRAFEYDKAVYEVLYEARHRPSWLPIPLDSIASLAGPESLAVPGSRPATAPRRPLPTNRPEPTRED